MRQHSSLIFYHIKILWIVYKIPNFHRLFEVEYYLLKLTTGPETSEQRFSDSWGGTFDQRLYYDTVLSRPFLFKLIPRKTAAFYSAAICFICAELEKDKNYSSGKIASWHSSVFRYMYLMNKINVTIQATRWLLLCYSLAKRWVYNIRNSWPSVYSFVRVYVPSIVSIKPENQNNR